jgi:putative SOS response-associated peptidase YedK
MCNRYVPPGEGDIERFWKIGQRNPFRWPDEIFPRAPGPFIRQGADGRALVVGQWALIPPYEKSPKLTYSTNNARYEDITWKRSFKGAWKDGQRCIIPALSFDEPCWETKNNVWWRFHRADGAPWGLAGLWNTWTDKATGEVVESYTMLTINADDHPLMSRMHKPDPQLPPDKQDKRSVVPIELSDVEQWLRGTIEEAADLVRVAPVEAFDGNPAK